MFLHDRRRAQRHIYWLFNSFAGASFWPLVCTTSGNVLLPTSMVKSCRSSSTKTELVHQQIDNHYISGAVLKYYHTFEVRSGKWRLQVSTMFLFSTRFVWFTERGCKHSGSADVCGKMTLSSVNSFLISSAHSAQSLISGHIEENMKPVLWSLVILAFIEDDHPETSGEPHGGDVHL